MDKYSPFKLDDFWKDCIDNQNNLLLKTKNKKKSIKIRNNNNLNTFKSNKIIDRRRNINKNNIVKIKTNVYYSAVNKIYEKLIQKHPELFQNKSNKDKKRIQNSMLKSIALYKDGIEKKKLIEKNMKENSQKKLNKELSLCTFRPKISKRKNEEENANPFYRRIYERDLGKIQKNKKLNRSLEVIKNENILNNKSKIRFKTNKSQIIFTGRENAEFILRYTKARDEKMFKIMKKIYKKDDSYDYYLHTLTSRIGNNEYKNSLNVNNILHLYGEKVSRNSFINSYIGDFKGLSYKENNQIKQIKKNKKIIMNEIRKELMEANDD